MERQCDRSHTIMDEATCFRTTMSTLAIEAEVPVHPQIPCRFYAAGKCRYGSRCRNSHDFNAAVLNEPATHDTNIRVRLPSSHMHRTPRAQQTSQISQDQDHSHAQTDIASQSQTLPAAAAGVTPVFGEYSQPGVRQRPKRGEIACRAWKVGTCARGDKCWFGHDPEVLRRREQEAQALAEEQERQRELAEERARQEELQHQLAEAQAQEEERQRRLAEERTRKKQERQRRLAEESARREAQAEARREEARLRREQEQQEREAERQARLVELAKEEAAKTIQRVVLGSIITFGAGLDIHGVITGFECCIIQVKSLPADAREDEVHALFTQQGIDSSRFQLVGMKRTPGGKQKAEIVIDAESGHALAVGLEQIEFRDESLSFEVGAYNNPGGMSAIAGHDSDVLTISWRASAASYVVTYTDADEAEEKMRQLNGTLYKGRRLKVMMNQALQTRAGPQIRAGPIRERIIRIYNLPTDATDFEMVTFAGSACVRRMTGGLYDVERSLTLLQEEVNRAVPGALRSFEHSSANAEGVMSARARFTSWDEAETARERLANKRFEYIGKSPIWCKLPSPMLFTVVIAIEQYRAQRTLWTAVVVNIPDKKACNLSIVEKDTVVIIRVMGSVKQATGALKLRVERLISGEAVDGWHRSLGYHESPFARRVLAESGAFLRTDWRRQTLRLCGEPRAVDRARQMIKDELERLAAVERSVTLKRQSVGYFVRHAVPALKEMLGEENVKFDISTRVITISGDEDSRHALDRFIADSLDELHQLQSDSITQQTCPICYCEVSMPLRLGCGHVYCTSCMRHFVTSAADSDKFPLVCMGDESRCAAPISIPTIQRFLPPASFNRLLEVVFNVHISTHPQDLKYCKTPDCTQIYRSTAENTASILSCPSCFSAVCTACHEEPHEGMSCEEYRIQKDPAEQERLNERWITQQGGRVKKCPRCSVLIEKTEGCNHMSCRCGAHICWRCMGVFTAEEIYPHMNTAHGGYYDQPILQGLAVDYGEQERLLREAEQQRQARGGINRRNEAMEEIMRRRERLGEEQRLLQLREDLRQDRARERLQEEERRRADERMQRVRRLMREQEQQARRAAEQVRVQQEERGWCMVM